MYILASGENEAIANAANKWLESLPLHDVKELIAMLEGVPVNDVYNDTIRDWVEDRYGEREFVDYLILRG